MIIDALRFALHLVVDNNFHVVEKDRFYRSGLLSKGQLEQKIEEHGIKTVIDLRRGGDKTGQEREVTASLGIGYLHIPFNSGRLPYRKNIARLLLAYERAAEPILVHCNSGVHRSGFASALWLLEKAGAPLEKVEKQLSSYFGFFRIERILVGFFSGYRTLDEAFWDYRNFARHQSISFQNWSEHYYDKSSFDTPD